MKTAKQLVLERVGTIRDDASMSEILGELYFQEKVTRGLEQADRGEFVTTEDVMKRIDRWLNYAGR